MSMEYCHNCNTLYDQDFDLETHENCEEQEEKENENE